MRLGTLRLTDAAPVILAAERGWFAESGLHASIAVEPSWANVADKLAWGLLDGAVLLHPLAIAMTLGLRGPATALRVAAGISRHGNAVTLSPALAEHALRGGPAPPSLVAARLRTPCPGQALPLLAVVHAFSTHDLLLRRFLASGGIAAGSVRITVVPPADMPTALATGRIDGFCAGAPWSAVAAADGSAARWRSARPSGPGMRRRCWWSGATGRRRIPDAMRVAGRGDGPSRRGGVRSRRRPGVWRRCWRGRDWIGVPAPLIAASLPGGSGRDADRSVFGAAAAVRPTIAEGLAFLDARLANAGLLPADAEADAAALYADF